MLTRMMQNGEFPDGKAFIDTVAYAWGSTTAEAIKPVMSARGEEQRTLGWLQFLKQTEFDSFGRLLNTLEDVSKSKSPDGSKAFLSAFKDRIWPMLSDSEKQMIQASWAR